MAEENEDKKSDPLRYPLDTTTFDRVDGSRRGAITFSLAAERLDLERLRLETDHARSPDELQTLKEAAAALKPVVRMLRAAEAASLAQLPESLPAPAAFPVGSPSRADPMIEGFRAFHRLTLDLASGDQSALFSNFHAPEGIGRWTGPGVVSRIGLDLDAFIEAGLRSIELEFAMTILGELPAVTKLLVGAKGAPMAEGMVRWSTKEIVRLQFEPADRPGHGLLIVTPETRQHPPDMRFLGVCLRYVRLRA
jgi:hypothetical protein